MTPTQLRCAELHTTQAEMALDHTLCAETNRELLILDCASTAQLRCAETNRELSILDCKAIELCKAIECIRKHKLNWRCT